MKKREKKKGWELSCRSQGALSNESLATKTGVGRAENGTSKAGKNVSESPIPQRLKQQGARPVGQKLHGPIVAELNVPLRSLDSKFQTAKHG